MYNSYNYSNNGGWLAGGFAGSGFMNNGFMGNQLYGNWNGGYQSGGYNSYGNNWNGRGRGNNNWNGNCLREVLLVEDGELQLATARFQGSIPVFEIESEDDCRCGCRNGCGCRR